MSKKNQSLVGWASRPPSIYNLNARQLTNRFNRSSCHGTTTASISLGVLFRPDGRYFGVQLQNAVKGYQHRVFLKEDGIVASITWEALYSGARMNMPIVMKGSSGNAVKIVQNVLKINGYYFGSIDGFFGTMTDVAVRQWQISKALPQDGIVSYRTWHALSKLPH